VKPDPLDRLVLALSLFQRGESLEAIGRRLGSRRAGDDGAPVGPATAVQVVRQGVRVVATGVLLGERPLGLPESLWPPKEVRVAMRAARGPRRREAAANAYRAWLLSGVARPAAAAPAWRLGAATWWQLVAWLGLALLTAASGRRAPGPRRG
jgi:hypothetical protein